MSWIDPRLWGAFLLSVVLAAGGGYWKGHHDADQSATVSALKKERDALKSDNDLYRQTTKTLAGISIDAKKSADTARADARASDLVADGLRKQLARYVAAARNSAVAGGSAPASDPIGVLADVLARADERAGKLAEFADAAHIAGLACERSYDALMGQHSQNDQK